MNNNAAKCQCPRKCPSTNNPVCASNGRSYKSECYMRVKACKTKKDLVVVRKGNCGKCISNRRKFLIMYVVLAARPLIWKKKTGLKPDHRFEQFIFCQNQCCIFFGGSGSFILYIAFTTHMYEFLWQVFCCFIVVTALLIWLDSSIL